MSMAGKDSALKTFPRASEEIPQHEPGAKLDSTKVRLGLVLDGFTLSLNEVAKVGTFGAKKYSDYGFLSVPNGEERYTDAMLRHLLTLEDVDGETGLLHDAAVAWNALARLEIRLRSEMKDLESKGHCP